MTHNFDFLRTIESRFVGYRSCLMASRNKGVVTLAPATGVRNIFARDWKHHFFDNPKKKVASIPFLRNLVEMTVGEDNSHYVDLTAMLHWKAGSETITVSQLDGIYNAICREEGTSQEPNKLVCELVTEAAEASLADNAGMNLENKIVLAIAIRLVAERFMIDQINDQSVLETLESNQAGRLTEEYKSRFPEKHENIATLDRVALMTPENIHVNSFMYEPIIDMSDDHLRKLFGDVKALC